MRMVDINFHFDYQGLWQNWTSNCYLNVEKKLTETKDA